MKDKEKREKVFDILDRIEFFGGQRAGRELWFDKPKEVQDQDISNFVKDIKFIRSYLQDSVVLTREELEEKYEPSEKFMSVARELEDLKESLVDKVVFSKAKYEMLVDCSSYEGVMKALKNEYTKGSKETAEKFANEVYKELYQLGKIYALPETLDADKYGIFSLTQEVIAKIAKEQFNVEIKE